MIIAKPVVKDKFWILKQDDAKVGNIEASSDGYTVRINNSVTRVKSIGSIRHDPDFAFEAPPLLKKPTAEHAVHGYQTGSRCYNGMWDVKRRLPLFTKNRKSKSWYAAGWYVIRQRREWEVVQNPKLIALQRYPYQGPYHTKEQANEHKS
jgi:hypothetical protein